MDQKLKERLIGATVLVILAVVFIPMLLDETFDADNDITGTNIPPKPESDFSSRIIPLPEVEIETVKRDEINEVARVEHKIDIKTPAPVQQNSTTEHNVGFNAWVVQLGSFSSEANAQALNEKLRDAGYPAFVEPLKESEKIAYRVRVGPELKHSDAQLIRDKINESMQLNGIVIRYP